MAFSTLRPRKPGGQRRRSILLATTVFGAALQGALFAAPASATLRLPADVKQSCIVDHSAFTGWFQSGTVTRDGIVTHPDSVGFHEHGNCSIYDWSEHMFLWLTSRAPDAYGGGGRRIFDSNAFYDVSPPDSRGQRHMIAHESGILSAFSLRAAQVGVDRLPVVMSRLGNLFEVVPSKFAKDGNQLILNGEGKLVEVAAIKLVEKNQPVFLDPEGNQIKKARPLIPKGLQDRHLLGRFRLDDRGLLFLDGDGEVVEVEQGQAGGNGVLESQGGSLVYYASMVNDVYAYFLTGIRNGELDFGSNDIRDAVFPWNATNLRAVKEFAARHGTTFPDAEALAVEVKTAWIDADTLSDPGNFVLMKATVPVYDRSDSQHWNKIGEKTKTLAMVGMHVVGSLAGHPEMIWATFEHQRNAPNASYRYIDVGGTLRTVERNTSGLWLFCADGASGPFNQAHMVAANSDIDATSGFSIGPSNTLRRKAWGAALDQAHNPRVSNAAQSNSEIISVNNSVRRQLALGDVRANYVMIGSTWSANAGPPGEAFPAGNAVGTSQLSNTTMETYQQGTGTQYNPDTNCFDCHRSKPGGSPTGESTAAISHLFTELAPLFD